MGCISYGFEIYGKVLLVKNLAINSDEVFSDFRRIPGDTTFAQAVSMLKAEEVKLAQKKIGRADKPEVTQSQIAPR